MADRPLLGDILVQAGLIDEHQLARAVGEQQRWGGKLGLALLRLGFVTEEELLRTLARQLGVPAVRLAGKRIDPEMLDLLPRELAEKYRCIPLFTKREGGREILCLGMDDPTNLAAIDDVSFRSGRSIRPVLIGPESLQQALMRFYGTPDFPSDERLAEADEIDSSETVSAAREPEGAAAPAPQVSSSPINAALEEATAASLEATFSADLDAELPVRVESARKPGVPRGPASPAEAPAPERPLEARDLLDAEETAPAVLLLTDDAELEEELAAEEPAEGLDLLNAEEEGAPATEPLLPLTDAAELEEELAAEEPAEGLNLLNAEETAPSAEEGLGPAQSLEWAVELDPDMREEALDPIVLGEELAAEDALAPRQPRQPALGLDSNQRDEDPSPILGEDELGAEDALSLEDILQPSDLVGPEDALAPTGPLQPADASQVGDSREPPDRAVAAPLSPEEPIAAAESLEEPVALDVPLELDAPNTSGPSIPAAPPPSEAAEVAVAQGTNGPASRGPATAVRAPTEAGPARVPAATTRDVLRALTELLIEKGVIEAAEVFERLGAVRAAGRPSQD